MRLQSLYGTSVVFKKRGSEVKAAIRKRCDQLRARLERRNRTLDDLIDDRKRLRSYLVLSTEHRLGMHEGSSELRSKDDISSEEIEDINQLCRRIREIEAEIYALELTLAHMEDDKEFELTLHELVSYGFEVSPSSE